MARQKKGSDGYYRRSFSFDGKQYSVRAKDPKKLSSKVAAKLQELQLGKLEEETATVQQWSEKWIAAYKTNLSPSGRNLLIGRVRNHILPHIGYKRVRDVRPIDCQAVLNAMEGYAQDTVKKVLQTMHAIFEAAQTNHIIRENPVVNLTIPTVAPAGTHRSITDRERLILLETAKTHKYGAWVLLLLYTGLRPGESVALVGSDIQDGYVHVTKALGRDGLKAPKSSAGIRKVPIVPKLAAVLPNVEPFALLFPNRVGNMLNEKAIARVWKSFLQAMKEQEIHLLEQGKISELTEALPPLVPYDLRHTFCTDLERAGVPLNVASQLMGHASIAITAKIYTHTTADVFDSAAAKMTALSGDIESDIHKSHLDAQNPIIDPENRKTTDTSIA